MKDEQRLVEFFNKHPEIKKMYEKFPDDYKKFFLDGILQGIKTAEPVVNKIGEAVGRIKK